MTIGELIEHLKRYDPSQTIYYMRRSGDVEPIREVSLFDSCSPHTDDNELSLTTNDFWED